VSDVEVRMPVLTDSGEDGVVTAWFVDDGAEIQEGALLAEVQVEKVADEVHAPAAGVVRDLVAINEPVAQGAPICRIVAGAAKAPPRPVASPAARRRARELGVDLATVSGSGPGGRITEADVERAAEPGTEGAELTGLRAVIARRMRQSTHETAAVTLTSAVDVTGVPAERFTARVVGAAARALVSHPAFNGTRDGDRFVAADEPAVALAIQTDEGLVAPVVARGGEPSIDEIAASIAATAERARSHALTADDFAGATFTVTNLGPYGIDAFTPIIDPPQIAILGVGAIRDRPLVDGGGRIVPGKEVVLSLTFDHAFVDGAPAAEFLGAIVALLPRVE